MYHQSNSSPRYEVVHPSQMPDPLDELVEALKQVWITDPNKINWKRIYRRSPAPQ